MNFFDYFINYYVHHIFGVTYIITELVACLCVSLVFNSVNFKKPKEVLRFLLDYVLTWLSYIFLSCFIYFLFEESNASSYSDSMRFFMWPIISLLHSLYPTKTGKYTMRLMNAIAVTSFVILAINISGTIGGLITDNVGVPSSLLSDITFYLILLVLILTVVLFKIFSPFKFHYVKRLPVLLIEIVFLISYAIVILTTYLISNEKPIYSAILFIALLFMDFIAYIVFYLNVENYNKIIDFQMKAMKAESEKSQIEISNSKYEELHRIKHELNNEMAILERLTKEKKYDELEKYFADISQNAHVVIDFVDCGNALLNTVLNMELSKAHAQDLNINFHISVPKDLPMDLEDMTSLFTNLLDNAIESEVRDHLFTPIEMKAVFDGNYLLLDVLNATIAAKEDISLGLLHSQKTDRLNHGYGTKIIDSICRKYSGVSKFYIEDGIFHFSGMLLLVGDNNGNK